MSGSDRRSLWHLTEAAGALTRRFLADADSRVSLAEPRAEANLAQEAMPLHGKTVLLATKRQLPAALWLLALDGLARRILLCPPDIAPEHIPGLIAAVGVDAIVSDGGFPAIADQDGIPVVSCHDLPPLSAGGGLETEWLLFTSGTTGRPKMVVHTLGSLTGPLKDGPMAVSDAVWSTFYDIRRYGGLQILLRALLGGGSLVLSQADESVRGFLTRAGACGVTHILGTPSHWRRALMSPAIAQLHPRYVRLSGEVADQAILTQLRQMFPDAGLTHAYASTEAGVGFEVTDGQEGFPASVIETPNGAAEIEVAAGSLRIRSARGGSRYFGDAARLADPDGFIDTGDMVTRMGDRYFFAGRREGIINVGGQKVHPEEVEAIINRHPLVQMARVKARASPITGAIVVADIVVRQATPAVPLTAFRDELLAACRAAMPAHKVPVFFKEVSALEIGPAGKLVRTNA